jgi:hypothetical protein
MDHEKSLVIMYHSGGIIRETIMWASWLSAGLLVFGALLGSLGAHWQYNPLLAIAGVILAAGIVISGFTECRRRQ